LVEYCSNYAERLEGAILVFDGHSFGLTISRRNENMMKKVVMAGVFFLLLLITSGIILAQTRTEPKIFLEIDSDNVLTPTPITLKEAWSILASSFENKDNQITALNSLDHVDDSVSAGDDGKRRVWQATIRSPEYPDSEFVVTIRDGLIIDVIEQGIGFEYLALLEPELDSPDAFKIAISYKRNFSPDHGKSVGFNYGLEYAQDGKAIITIRGIVENVPAIISIDANNGEMISAKQLSFEGGGILFSKDKGQTWRASDLIGTMIIKIVADPIMAEHAYAVGTDGYKITIYQTVNGGESWSIFNELPNSAGYWPYDLAMARDPLGQIMLFVSTESDIWISKDSKTWETVLGLPEGPKQWLEVAYTDSNEYRLFASITYGDHQGLYGTDNLSQWDHINDLPLRLSPSYDRKWVLATNDQNIGKAILLSKTDELTFDQFEPILRAAGDFNGKFVTQSPVRGISMRNSAEIIEEKSLLIPIASIAAAPDFSLSNILLAGGFRTGIFVSRDGGRSWEVIVNDPSQIVSGNNEIYCIKFLSSTTIVAVNGGFLTWKEF
jgi:photosystem II stability/assembly factor-like uncharacterized protein